MRLTEAERRAIREAVAEVYGPTAVVRLFGSRVHDHLRGGDIDLHVEADDVGFDKAFDRKIELRINLKDRLGERRIDLLFTPRGGEANGIEAVAYRDGVLL